ncbi:hypothetical protein PENTCL1PPCAC_680 [Pristionchus entomophagus]|uniref:Uncharacterized protein n=1 Tax=Pristionchus entomophagus TaxID=358040 RepID=A0AAV5S8U0_9BILA|nr:hypothetical protein PENTCL1PPCAC_680 [Pristionchus entomophagus]
MRFGSVYAFHVGGEIRGVSKYFHILITITQSWHEIRRFAYFGNKCRCFDGYDTLRVSHQSRALFSGISEWPTCSNSACGQSERQIKN